MFRRLAEWNRRRVQEDYKRILSEYSPEERKLIAKARRIPKFMASKKEVEEVCSLELERLEGRKNGYVAYDGYSMLGNLGIRESNVRRWLDLGELGADVLVECPGVGVGPDGAGVFIGRPVKITRLKADFNPEGLGRILLRRLRQRDFI